ncbi:NAD-dependent epimerase/dehydratase family protein [Kitasatospora sp. NPDC001261]|uniref:NAD-dependent epimerase/dehydratase family protein n=1 Tax=Kitasatospora sp. NPDC001261 TaxID=3364012 RepID=UPI0036C8C5B7
MSGPAAAARRPHVTVLGASGFVGSVVLGALAQRPLRLRAVARGAVAVPPAGRAEVEVVAADVTDPEALRAAVAGSDAVVHLVSHRAGWRGAGQPEEALGRTNAGVMSSLLPALRQERARRGGAPVVVLFAGSTSQAGPDAPIPVDESAPDAPASPYDRQKAAAERELLAATAEGAVRGACLRLPTVYGRGAPAGRGDRGVLATMVRRALAGEPLTMWHDGSVRRDLLHVDDTGRAFLAALDRPDAVAGRYWVLGTGHGEPLGRVFRAIADGVAVRTGRPAVPVVSVPPPEHALPTDLRSTVADSSRFRAATGWRPLIPLDAGLADLIANLADLADL